MIRNSYIGLLVKTKKSRKTQLEKYLEHDPERKGKGKGKLFAFTYKDIDWPRKEIHGLCRAEGEWLTLIFPFPACVFNRRFTTKTKTVGRLEQVIGKGKIFNARTRFDKWEIHYILQGSPVVAHLSTTVRLEGADLQTLLGPGESWFVKPCVGYKGKRVHKVRKDPAGIFHIYDGSEIPKHSFTKREEFETQLRQLAGNRPCILQKEIPLLQLDDRMAELRLILQKDGSGKWGVTGGLAKVAYPNIHLTNYCSRIAIISEALEEAGYEPEQRDNLNQRLKDISIQTAILLERALGTLGEITVDFGVDKEGMPRIIEVNGSPSKQLIEESGDREFIRNFYVRPLQYADYLVHKE